MIVTLQVTSTLPEAFAFLYSGNVVHRVDLVLARPALGREERVQPIGISARIGIGTTWPRFLSFVVLVTLHCTWSGENGTSSSRRSLFTSSPEGDVDVSLAGMAKRPPLALEVLFGLFEA